MHRKSNAGLPTPPGRVPPPSDAVIAQRARELWHAYGQPAGRDERLWLEAERELRGLDLRGNALDPAGRVQQPD